MKKLGTLLSLFVLLTAFMCENEPIDSDISGNNNNNSNNPTSIVGTWLLTAWNAAGEPLDLNNDGTPSTNLLDEMDCYTNETLVFNTDGTGQNNSTSFATFEFIIEVGTTNSYEFFTYCTEDIENSNFTWSQSNNTVTLTESGQNADLTLSGNELSFLVPEGFVALNTDNATITITRDLTFVYTKQ